jgi:hypothetical protein
MDDAKFPNTPDDAIPANGLEVEDVTTHFQVAGGASRGPARIIVAKTGRSYSNTEAYDVICAELTDRGVSLENLYFACGANRALGVIALRPSNMATPGAMPATVGDKALRFHLGGVFKQHPSLRPNTTVECPIDFTTDAKGRWCITINPRQGAPKRAGASDPENAGNVAVEKQVAELKKQRAELEQQKAELARQKAEVERQMAELAKVALGKQEPAADRDPTVPNS